MAAPTVYEFTVLDRPFAALQSDEMKRSFQKWDLTHCQAVAFRFNEPFARINAGDFVAHFFNSPAVQAAIRVVDRGGTPTALHGKVQNVKFKQLGCTAVTLDLFDKFYSADIIREDDQSISKCMDRYLDGGVTVADRLRETLMCGDDCDHCELFTDEEKNEFLYHVLWRIAAGGALCQWEDDFTPYRDAARGIYKDLVGVQKNPLTQELEAVSVVYQVHGLDASVPLFARCGVVRARARVSG
eukprot:TRINITY_DN9984_c0_g1_i4.p1 TRINITY_DN9984_c0_g1~~TRINITY_DN9984_c0_g1_i4.p1  ORF type:complete len:261 (+),score=79.82 TRINITY_DN9984_c0_g1_i4:59-784(+)